MKKIFALCLIMVMVVTMSVSALAAPSGFVSSPSGNSAPTVESFKPQDEDCTADLVITPYSEKNNLPQDRKDLMKKAYDSITEADDLTELNKDLKALVEEKNISSDKLAVSDLFDAYAADCESHDGHFNFDIVLNMSSLKNFVGLLYLNHNNEWELVKNARVTSGGHLKFTVAHPSQFAVVVDTSKSTTLSPQTGDSSMNYIYAAVMVVSALAIAVIAVKSKKREA